MATPARAAGPGATVEHAAHLAPRARRRLSDTLDRATGSATRLTLVSAPPGYGKSVAVSGWVAGRGLAAAWADLEPADSDPASLARRILEAMRAARPAAGALGRAIAPGTPPDARYLADVVIDAIASLDADLILVLDDWHHAAGPGTATLLRRLVERLPPFGHLVLVSREDPALPLGRLRAHGALVEIRSDELRFTRAEAEAFLADQGVQADSTLVDRLMETTEGWPAALQLAVLTLPSERGQDLGTGPMTGTHRHVIDYLGDEVMAGLDGGLRALLSAAALAEPFCAELGALMTGRSDAAGLLAQADRSNLFLVPLDPGRTWYRMHGLFAGYLRSTVPDHERRRLHAIAAAWYEAAAMPRHALGQALAAGDHDRARRLVASEGRAAFEAGELRTLERWLAALPAEMPSVDPEIASLAAWTRFYTGDLAGAASLADRALEGQAEPSRGRGRLLVLLALIGTTTRPDAEALAEAGLGLLGDDELFRSLGLQAAGLARLARGELEPALALLRDALEAAETSGVPIAVLPAVNPLGHALVATGRRDEAERVARRVLAAYPGPAGEPLAVAWPARLTLGIALREGGQVVEARGELERGLAAAGSLGVRREVLGWALPSLALARQATGDARGALAILERDPGPRMGFPSLARETEARVRLAQGDLEAAARWADNAQAEAPEGSPLLALLQASAGLTVARIRLAEGRTADADVALADARPVLNAWGTVPDRVSACLLAGSTAFASGDRAMATGELARAVELARPGGYVRRFVDDGRPLAALLAAVEAASPVFVDRIRAALREGSEPRPRVQRGTTVLVGPDGELVESLTPRELDVLRLLATGERNAGIAVALGVSPGTAKWHVAHVLGKLGATSRTGAVVRGQQLGLL